jgi:hypothetical protein
MTKDEALDLALEALENVTKDYVEGRQYKHNKAITAIKQARSAPVQEPEYTWPTVADYERDVGFQVGEAFKMAWNMARTTNGFLKLLSGEAPSPAAQRTWVGLSHEEVMDSWDEIRDGDWAPDFYAVIEAKLKERNV